MAADSPHARRPHGWRSLACWTGTGLLPVVAAGLALASTTPRPAQAQVGNECEKLAVLLKKQSSLVQTAQGFAKKKPTAAGACTVFTQLSGNASSLVAELEANGTWCHAPPEFVDNIKKSQPQIATARTNACNAAAQQKKMEAQARKQQQNQQQGAGPIGGGGDVLGGPIKVPQGAL